MAAPKGLTIEIVIESLKKTHGNISLSARELRVDRKAIKYYIDTYATVKAVHDEESAWVSDISEGNIVRAITQGNLNESHYWLENKARDRGYGRAPQSTAADLMNATPEQLAAMTDEQLDDYIAKLDKIARAR